MSLDQVIGVDDEQNDPKTNLDNQMDCGAGKPKFSVKYLYFCN